MDLFREKIMAELITENELEIKVRSFKDKSSDRIVVSANQRDEKWFLKISHTLRNTVIISYYTLF